MNIKTLAITACAAVFSLSAVNPNCGVCPRGVYRYG